MKILIATGIYPPHIGGPAQYAFEVKKELERQGHTVKVLTYNLERKLPTLIRHKLFFLRTFFSLSGVDLILALDMFSVGWPASWAAKLLGKKIVIRTGGDFLWESYVERTGDLVLFKDFYTFDKLSVNNRKNKLSLKEKIIFGVTKRTLKRVSGVIFSTEWQRDIFIKAYNLDANKCFIVENFYGEKINNNQAGNPNAENKKIFVGGTRLLKWKNIPVLKQAFEIAKSKSNPNANINTELELDLNNAPYQEFIHKIQHSYAVILVSLGDISPNMILDALRCNKPCIVTRETGLYNRLKDTVLFVDPKNPNDIAEKILYLSDSNNYQVELQKIKAFTFTHSWQEIVQEILAISKKV